jgi:hypothetical protein
MLLKEIIDQKGPKIGRLPVLAKEQKMSFWNPLKSLFSSNNEMDSAYYLYVRCQRCGEVIRTRIDLQQSLSQNDEGGYTINKTLVGNRHCFERIEVILTFDESRRLISRDVSRGEFVTKQEYETAQQAS